MPPRRVKESGPGIRMKRKPPGQPGARFGQNGNYLSELEAQPGGPEGRPHTTAGSKPIATTGRPQGVRPRSLNSDHAVSPNLPEIRREHPVPSPVSSSRTDSSPEVQRSGAAGILLGYESSWFNHARYDTVNRLASNQENGVSPDVQTYGYDGNGNWYLAAYNTSQLAMPTNETPRSSSWFGSNNQISSSGWTYDNAGNLTGISSVSKTFTYDAESRQTTAVNGGLSGVYTYDGDGRRVTKVVNAGPTTTYVYDAQGSLIAEYGGLNPIFGTTYVDVDHLGSTRLVTDSGGNQQSCNDYLPFGGDILSGTDGRGSCYPSTAPSSGIKFTGQERDAESSLDYFGARYFSGAQGRFTSPDPGGVGGDPGSPRTWNMYSYTGNNPLSAVDPNGLDCVYTSNQTGSSITAAVERGNCSQNGGTFVNGTIDVNSLSYTGSSLDFGYVDPNGVVGAYSKGLPDPLSYSDQFINEMGRRGQASNQFIGAFAAGQALFATAIASTYAVPAAMEAISAARVVQAAAALRAAQLALKALPPDQYRLLQQWLGPIKAGSPITAPPPGLTADAMQRYLAVAEAYIAAGGSGAAIQAARVQALNAALGNK